MNKCCYVLLCMFVLFPNNTFTIGGFFKDLGKKTKKGFEKGFKETKKGVTHAAQETEKGVKTAVRKTKEGVEEAVKTVSREAQNLTDQIENALKLPLDKIQIHSIKGRATGKELLAGKSPTLQIEATIPTSLKPGAGTKKVNLRLQADPSDTQEFFKKIAEAILKQF